MERRKGISAESRVHLKHRGSALRAVHGIKSSDYACMGGKERQGVKVEGSSAGRIRGTRDRVLDTNNISG